MPNNLRALYQVMRDAKRPRSALGKLIYERLKPVLVSAYRHVPYYRELMQSAGYNPVKDYKGPGDLSFFPITTKEDLKRQNVASLVRAGTDLSRYFSDATSGSTGIPFRVYRAPYERSLQIAKWLRVLFLNGYSVRDKVMSLTSPARMGEGRSILQKFGIFPRLPVNYQLSPATWVDTLLAYKPDVIYGPRSGLDLMAIELKERGITAERIKLLIPAGETIYKGTRSAFRQHFGVELTEFYGSVEMGTMAHETPARDGMHLFEDLTYFEFVDGDGNPAPPGQPARIVVTDLMGKLMPFIRFDQGDLGVYKELEDPNGKVVRRLQRILGREDDLILLPDGSRRIFNRFMNIMDEYPRVRQFRVVQKSLDLFHVLAVADEAYLKSIHTDLTIRLKRDWPPQVHFEVIPVERIEPDPSGKTRSFISEVG